MKNPCDLYIITTARKRDTFEWEVELNNFDMSSDISKNKYKNNIIVDSWNNIHKYVDSSGGVAAGERTANGFTASGNTYAPNLNSITLPQCGAKISIYGHGYNTPIAIIDSSASSFTNERDRYWFPFCLNGRLGMDSLKVVNKVQANAPTPADCEALY